MTTIEKIIGEFQEDYKKTYKNMLSDELLENGNQWFESFLRQSLLSIRQATIEEVREEIENLKTEPHLYEWIERMSKNPTRSGPFSQARIDGWKAHKSATISLCTQAVEEVSSKAK